ncbi:hypothetical protein OAS89_04955 [Alphaproteobacteria bacterium]|nr:hypothetical protein [Alphaproteobacteria bacterium]
MSLFGMFGLLLVFNPLTALLFPVVFRLVVKSKKLMDFYTYGLYVGLYFALVVVVSFVATHLQTQDAGTVAKVSDSIAFRFREFIILAFFARLVLGFAYVNFTQQRLNSLSKSNFWLILLAVPIISPIFSLVLLFWREKPAQSTTSPSLDQ